MTRWNGLCIPAGSLKVEVMTPESQVRGGAEQVYPGLPVPDQGKSVRLVTAYQRDRLLGLTLAAVYVVGFWTVVLRLLGV
jgi:hypothetical protein